MESMEQAREQVEWAKGQAVKTLLEYGNHRSILVGFTPEGEQDLVLDVASVPPSARWPLLRGVLMMVGAVGYVLIDEAWVHRPRPDEIETIGGDAPGQGLVRRRPGVPMPRDHPDRREALLVHWQFKLPGAGEWAGLWQQLFRHEGEAIVVEEVEDMPEADLSGRAVHLLDPAPGDEPMVPDEILRNMVDKSK